MALNGLFCADVPLRNYSLTHSDLQYLIQHPVSSVDIVVKRHKKIQIVCTKWSVFAICSL